MAYGKAMSYGDFVKSNGHPKPGSPEDEAEDLAENGTRFSLTVSMSPRVKEARKKALQRRLGKKKKEEM
jgi:hypothetical protein